MTALAHLGARFNVTRPLRRWLMDRVKTRRGNAPLPFEFEYRHIYVMPTAFGTAFGIMLILMALGGLNFNNNMALLLVFVLGMIAQLTTLLAYRNHAGLRLDAISAEPVFCGEPAHFSLFLSNPEQRPRFAIQAAFSAAQDCRDIAPNSTAGLTLHQRTRRRGWAELKPFKIENRYPLGLFRAWSWYFPAAKCLVYPEPANDPPPLPVTGAGHTGRAVKGDGEQLHGLREYRLGDSLKRVAWRTSARHDALYTREMETPRQEACELNWDLLSGFDTEKRLSILTSWVLLAERHQLSFSLELPGKQLPADRGVDHSAACLEALALYGL